MNIRAHLTADAKVWTKLWSMRFALATTVFSSGIGAYVLLPDRLKDLAPLWLVKTLIIGDVGTSVGCGLSRVWRQASLSPDTAPAPYKPMVPPNATP